MGHNTCKSMGRVYVWWDVKAIVPENTCSRLWDVLLLLDHSLCSFIITRQPIQRKKYDIDMFFSEINETNLIMFNYGPYTKHSSIYSETVVNSTSFFHFPALIFLSFGIYTLFVCVYYVRTSLFWRNKIILCLISRRVPEKIENSIQMLHENGKICCTIEKQVISRYLVKNRGISFCVCVPSAHRNWTRFSFSISEKNVFARSLEKKYAINMFISLKVSPHKFIRAYHY